MKSFGMFMIGFGAVLAFEYPLEGLAVLALSLVLARGT